MYIIKNGFLLLIYKEKKIMKKLLFICLSLGLIFTSCKKKEKEDGHEYRFSINKPVGSKEISVIYTDIYDNYHQDIFYGTTNYGVPTNDFVIKNVDDDKKIMCGVTIYSNTPDNIVSIYKDGTLIHKDTIQYDGGFSIDLP